MRIIGHGIDIIECERIAFSLKKHPDQFLERILTEKERAYCESMRDPIPNIAGRFAVKEAILKVIGTGWRGQIAWSGMEITNNEAGAPMVTLSGEVARVAASLGIERIIISISHTKHYAVGSAIGEGG
jgi:holo-[acyl-carrier protein] synthase